MAEKEDIPLVWRNVMKRTPRGSESSIRLQFKDEEEVELQPNVRDIVIEIIKDEEMYIDRTKSICEEYHNKMDDTVYKKLMPEELIGQKKLIFGNVYDIYTFHNSKVRGVLYAYKNRPDEIGRQFVNLEAELTELYGPYMENLPTAYALIDKAKPDNKFFEYCRKRTSHERNIKDLMHDVHHRLNTYVTQFMKLIAACKPNLQALQAVNTLQAIFKRCNNIPRRLSIRGYDSKELNAAGKLIKHGSLKVQTDRFLSKRKLLHLFLYENLLLFCKEKAKPKKDVSYKTIYSIELQKPTLILKLGLSPDFMKDIGRTYKIEKDHHQLIMKDPKHFYVITARSTVEQQAWYKALRNHCPQE